MSGIAAIQLMCVRRALSALGSALGAILCLLSSAHASDAERFDRANAQLLEGRYEEAIAAFESLADDPDHTIAAVAGLSRAFRLTGEYEKALSVLQDIVERSADSDIWHLARAEALSEVGRYEEATSAAGRAVELNARNTSARRLLGQLYELTGERDKAIETYAWFVTLLERTYPTQAVALTDAGMAIQRHAVLTSHADTSQRTRYVLQELFQPAYNRFDKRYWPACLAAADLLLGKYNLEEAAEEYEAALAINPHLADAHVGLGQVALARWQFEQVEAHIASAREINRRGMAAHRLEARLHVTERKYAAALASARNALQVNPGDLESLGLLAAAQWLSGDTDEASATQERARSVHRRPAVFHHELAQWLAAARRFAEAERHFIQATELDANWADPQTSLGLLYMETGEERRARRILDKAWNLDRFNAKTFHTLNLLDELERFGQDETEHFIIKTGEGTDAAIRPLMAGYLEEIYHEITSAYGAEPAEKTVIEVFPEHHWFAIRISHRPFIHTIGACTGRVIALDSPGRATQPFNWARVLRHEFTHTVTLDATGYRIPHWFTEGLAVRAENAPRPWAWKRKLAMAYRRYRLFGLDEIDWAFIRPRRADDRELAYAQSAWIVEYLVEKNGVEVIRDMLEAFRDGRTQDEVFGTVVGEPPAVFMVSFREWAAVQIEGWNLPVSYIPPIPQLREALEAGGLEPAEEATYRVAMAEAHLDNGDVPAARAEIERALAVDDDHRRGLVVRMDVLLALAGRADSESERDLYRSKAVSTARRLHELDAGSPDAAWVLAGEAVEGGDQEEAIDHLLCVQRKWPSAAFSYRHLADLAFKRGDLEAALREWREQARLQPHNASLRRRVADELVQADRQEEASEWLRGIIEITPYDVGVHRRLGELLVELARYDHAVGPLQRAVQLEPDRAGHHARLAEALHRSGRTEEARASAQRAVILDPQSSAREILDPP